VADADAGPVVLARSIVKARVGVGRLAVAGWAVVRILEYIKLLSPR
jgi:hypothetical protein